MSKSSRTRGKGKKERHISVRSVRREQPDVRKLAQVLIHLVQAQAEVDAEAQHTSKPSLLPNNVAHPSDAAKPSADARQEISGAGDGR